MEKAETAEEYAGESVPDYGQTDSGRDSKEATQKDDQDFHVTEKPSQSTWKYHNLESELLEYLCFLAEHKVKVVRREDLSKNDPEMFESGTSMQVFRGQWKDEPVVLKYPLDAQIPTLDDCMAETHEFARQLDSYRLLRKNIIFEIQVMSHSHLNQHRNIVKLLAIAFEDFLVTPKNKILGPDSVVEEIFLPILVLQPAVAEFPTLEHYFQRHVNQTIPIQQASSFICDVASGLAAIHSHGIVHGDIKPSNVLLFEESVSGETHLVAKISDFGSAGLESIREDIRGKSPYWAAPEVLERPSGWSGLRRTPAADVYSFGLLAATIALNGRKLFESVSNDYHLRFNKDEACEYVKKRLQNNSPGFNCVPSQDPNAYLNALTELVDHTVRLSPLDRWADLSVVLLLFDQHHQTKYDLPKANITPFHSYGTYAHPGVKPLAPIVAEEIYHQLPLSIKLRLAYHVQNFEEASTDTQTLLVWLALEMIDDPALFISSEDLVHQLLALRLLRNSPPQTPAPLELDPSDVGGFHQMYLRDIVKDGKPEPPILQAVRDGNIETVRQLIGNNPEVRRSATDGGWNGLHYSAYFDRAEFITLFLEGLNPLGIDNPGGRTHLYTPLHIAAWHANPECVKQLLNHGAKVNARSMVTGDFSFTPLLLCIQQKKTHPQKIAETIRLLLGAGASTELRFQGSGIAHILADRDGGGAALKEALNHEPGLVHQLTPNNQTPLHRAAGVRNLDTARVLLSFGASVHVRNAVGDTPLHNAYMSIGPSTRQASKHYDEGFVSKLVGGKEDAEQIIQLLIEAGADEDALGDTEIPWDTPEFRMYDEYEDFSEVEVSPGVQLSEQSMTLPAGWTLKEWLYPLQNRIGSNADHK